MLARLTCSYSFRKTWRSGCGESSFENLGWLLGRWWRACPKAAAPARARERPGCQGAALFVLCPDLAAGPGLRARSSSKKGREVTAATIYRSARQRPPRLLQGPQSPAISKKCTQGHLAGVFAALLELHVALECCSGPVRLLLLQMRPKMSKVGSGACPRCGLVRFWAGHRVLASTSPAANDCLRLDDQA